MEPMPGEIEEAKRHPTGWVYRINGKFGPYEAVPPEAIVGAWKVDAEGKIVGGFIPNSKFVSDEEHGIVPQTARVKAGLWITVAVTMAIATWLAVHYLT